MVIAMKYAIATYYLQCTKYNATLYKCTVNDRVNITLWCHSAVHFVCSSKLFLNFDCTFSRAKEIWQKFVSTVLQCSESTIQGKKINSFENNYEKKSALCQILLAVIRR